MKVHLGEKFWFYAFICLLFVLVGGTLNVIVMDANECQMPIRYSENGYYTEDACYLPFTSFQDVNMPILSDIIDIKTKHYITHFSIGDIIASLGGLGLTALSIWKGIDVWKNWK